MSEDHGQRTDVPVMTPEYEGLVRQTIASCGRITNSIALAVSRARVAPGHVDLTPLVLESLGVLLSAQSLLLDELLVIEGKERSIQVAKRGGGGNGRAEGPALVGGS